MSAPSENKPLNIRIKLALLWTALMFLYLYGDYFKFYIPEETEKLIRVDTLLNTPIKLLSASVMLAIPPLVIICNAMATFMIARWMNIIFGVFFTAIMVLIALTSGGGWWMAYTFYAVIESLITIIIVWQAWKWNKGS